MLSVLVAWLQQKLINGPNKILNLSQTYSGNICTGTYTPTLCSITEMDEEKIIDIKMYVPEEASTATYEVIKVSERRYKLTNNDPFSEMLTYGAIIEVLPEKKDGDTFTFKKIYAESEFNLEVIGLPMSLNETEMRVVGQMITKEGGYWEVIFGGMRYVNLPKTSKLNVIDQLNKLIREKQEN